MKAEFLAKANENIKAAELLFDHELYNASANRAYYAAFQAAIAALIDAGVSAKTEGLSHQAVQAKFNGTLIGQRKIYPGHLKSYLVDLHTIRGIADYQARPVPKKVALRQLRRAKEFVGIINQEIDQ
jgi:uncharacterized protein (UPF0332 family)